MPYDSNGIFTHVMNQTSDYENGIKIVCDRHDDEDDNIKVIVFGSDSLMKGKKCK